MLTVSKALIKNLENFTLFDEETDFELMAKNNIASDKSVIIDYGKRNEINELLTKNISFKDGLLINHLGMSYEVIFQILHEPDEDHDTSYEKQLSFFNEYNNKIINGDDLAHCIRVAPEFTKKLFENHWDKITDGGQLTSCLSAAPEFMKKFLKDNPDFEEKLFENHGGKITNGRQLDACLEVNPKLADIFTKEYGGNKKSATDSKKNNGIFSQTLIYNLKLEAVTCENLYQLPEMIFENPELFESKSIRPHYLSFQDISEAKINLLLQREGIKEILSEVSVVNLKIKNSQDINDLALNRLLKQLPKLCLAMSPTGEIADKITKAFPELLVEIDYNHLHKSHLQNQEALNQALNKLNFSTGDKPKLSLVKGSASGTERDLIKSGDDGKTVLYPEDCGNALNCPNPPYIRISQGIFPNIGKNFNEDFCYDEAFLNEQKSLTEYQVLSQQIIDRLTTQTNQTDPNYYLINVVVPSKDCYYRLLSIADGEEIAYIKTEPETKIEIKKGEDGFFYIKSDSNQTPLAVSYILKSSKSLEADANNDLAKIKDEDLVSEEFGGINILQIGKEVIQKYRDGRPFSGVPSLDSLNDLENSYKESKHKEWLENLFNQKAGCYFACKIDPLNGLMCI